MNAGEKRIIVGLGLSLAVGAALHYLYKLCRSAPVTDLPREDGLLSAAAVVRIIEEIKRLCRAKLVRCTQRELRIACVEARQQVQDQPAKYEEVVLSFLTREREALHASTLEVLAQHGVSKDLFDASLHCSVQLEEAARDLSHSLHIDLDLPTPAVPEGLTLEVYNEVMAAFETMLIAAVKQYKGEVPIPPFSLVLMFMRVYDALRAQFHYSEFELAAAGEVYAKGQVDLQHRLQLLMGTLAPSRQVRASSK